MSDALDAILIPVDRIFLSDRLKGVPVGRSQIQNLMHPSPDDMAAPEARLLLKPIDELCGQRVAQIHFNPKIAEWRQSEELAERGLKFSVGFRIVAC
ncbi:MAG TPA: hypothetical protein VH370_26025 [Humisphaera sp.]|nr:hypothetical protein [Humisphaera sp.]